MVREDLFHLMLKYYLSSNLLISLLGQRKNLTPEIMANFVKKFKYAVQLFKVDVVKQDPVI